MDSVNYRYMDSLFLENYKKMESLKIYTEQPLQVKYVTDGIVLPCRVMDGKKYAGVIEKDGKYIENSRFDALSEVDSWGGSYDYDLSSVHHCKKTVIYMGRFWKHWGHFLMDLISRLWYVMEDECVEQYWDCKIVYDSSEDISGGYLELLQLLGINEKQLIRIDEPTQFDQIIVPDCSFKPGIMLNKKFKEMYDVIIDNALNKCDKVDIYKNRNIYFTRKNQRKKVPMEVGEADVERIFRRNGYLIIAPEQYSVVEQISMVHVAKRIACISGTLPHNMVFAHDGEELIIVRKTNKPNYRQTGIDEMRKLKVITIDAHISLKAVGAGGPFILDVNDNLKRFCWDNHYQVKCSKMKQFFFRKGRVLWYFPVWWFRNHGKNPRVPLFDGKKFGTEKGAERKLFQYYLKRV